MSRSIFFTKATHHKVKVNFFTKATHHKKFNMLDYRSIMVSALFHDVTEDKNKIRFGKKILQDHTVFILKSV